MAGGRSGRYSCARSQRKIVKVGIITKAKEMAKSSGVARVTSPIASPFATKAMMYSYDFENALLGCEIPNNIGSKMFI